MKNTLYTLLLLCPIIWMMVCMYAISTENTVLYSVASMVFLLFMVFVGLKAILPKK